MDAFKKFQPFLTGLFAFFIISASSASEDRSKINLSDLSDGDQYLFDEIRQTLNDWTGEYKKLQLAKNMIDSFVLSNPDYLPIYIEQARLTIMTGYTGSNDYIKSNEKALQIIKQIQTRDCFLITND